MSLLAVEHYQSQLRQEEAAAILARRQWRGLSLADLDGSWAQIVNRLTLMVSAAQLGAARAGALYVAQAVAVNPDGEVRPEAWAGVAADGRPLDSLLFASVVHTKERLAAGIGAVEALGAGQAWLDMLVRTQVADAARGAAGVAVTARPHVGYVRVVSPPCCKRCAVLAGKFFKWNQGFLRHPRCDCRHEPLEEGAQVPRPGIDPSQVRDLTVSQRQAIADGADMNQVINSDRKRALGGMTTSEGTTRRGLAGQRGATRRLTPEGVYRVSASREEALKRLRANGYLL
jgi:hypothetical protein